MKNAIIIADRAEERRNIAQLLKPSDLFSQIYFCSNEQEMSFLLQKSSINLICCDVSPRGKTTQNVTAQLLELAKQNRLQLLFFSHYEPFDLVQLGVIPADCHCLSYEASPTTTLALLNHLLAEFDTTAAETSASSEELSHNGSDIHNKFYFDAILDQELSRSKLTGRPFSLLLIEPQTTEQQLSRRAAEAWNSLLPSLATTIKSQIRTSDLLCRLEHKRLALLLPETTSNNAERVRSRIQGKLQELEVELPLAFKFGLASPSQSNSFNRYDLLREAEASF